MLGVRCLSHLTQIKAAPLRSMDVDSKKPGCPADSKFADIACDLETTQIAHNSSSALPHRRIECDICAKVSLEGEDDRRRPTVSQP
jgi:hypothetical protein